MQLANDIGLDSQLEYDVTVQQELSELKKTMQHIHNELHRLQNAISIEHRKMWIEIAVLKTKVALYGSIAGLLASLIFEVLVKHFRG